MPYPVIPMEQRFWKKVEKTRKCWVWTGATNGRYGSITAPSAQGGGKVLAHRYSWELANGPIPAGAGVLHRCDNTVCVRPSHLYLGDQGVNMRDASSKGRTRGQRTTHCPKGHKYTPANTYYEATGARRCRACNNERNKRRLARKPTTRSAT